jgi:hypothetical protein
MCIAEDVLQNLTEGVIVLELDEHEPLDAKRLRVRFVNQAACTITKEKRLKDAMGMTICSALPEWCENGNAKRFIKAYFRRNVDVMMEEDVFDDGYYVMRCIPSAENRLMVIFHKLPKPKRESSDSFSIENLEAKTLKLLGNYSRPRIVVGKQKSLTINW